MVERLLHQVLHGGLDGLARAGQDRLDFGAADHLAHGAFGDRLHGAFGILDVEQVFADAGRLDLPQHREIDVDDVLVAGEHQAFFRHVAHVPCRAAMSSTARMPMSILLTRSALGVSTVSIG